jgi:hemerythrin-like metal-binding protein
MNPLNWHDELNTGLMEVNRGNRQLVHLISALRRLIRERQALDSIHFGAKVLLPPLFPEDTDRDANILRTIESLMAHCSLHFGHEETLLDRAEHPRRQHHRAAHAAFLKQVGECFDSFKAGQDSALDELLKRLSNWLFRHVARDDLIYSGLPVLPEGNFDVSDWFPEIPESISTPMQAVSAGMLVSSALPLREPSPGSTNARHFLREGRHDGEFQIQ